MIKKEYFCPYCNKKLDEIDGWGSISYYCMDCNMLISRSKMLTKESLDEIKKQEN